MNRKLTAVLFWFLAACLAAAQQGKPTQGAAYNSKAEPPAIGSLQWREQEYQAVLEQASRRAAEQQDAAAPRMYEDIEIMRRLLIGKLASFSQGPGHAGGFTPSNFISGLTPAGTFTQDLNIIGESLGGGAALLDYDNDGYPDLFISNGQSGLRTLYRNKGDGTFEDVTAKVGLHLPAHRGIHGIPTAEPVEGYYLKGLGVTYSVSLAVLSQPKVKAPARPAHKPISQWERLRKELRGEKVGAEDGVPERREETVVDTLLKLLAENGHNFSQLPENEQLTVAVTLRSGENCTNRHVNLNAVKGMMGAGGNGAMGGGGGTGGNMAAMMGGRGGAGKDGANRLGMVGMTQMMMMGQPGSDKARDS